MFGNKRKLDLGTNSAGPCGREPDKAFQRNGIDYAGIGPLLAQIPPFMTWWLYECENKKQFRCRVEYVKDGFKQEAGAYGESPAAAVSAILAIIAKGNHSA